VKAPKIIRDGLAALIGTARKENNLDKLVTGLSEAHAQVEAAIRDRDAADTAYRGGLLDVSEADLEALLREKGAATVRLDKAEALVVAFNTRIAAVRESEARVVRQAIYDDAVAKAAAIKARLPGEYTRHALAIRHLLRDLCEAEAAIVRAGEEASDFPPIASPEIELRAPHGLAEEIVEQETILLWCMDGRTDPLPNDRQSKVRRSADHFDRGILYMPSGGGPYTPTTALTVECTLRPYTRTRYREAMPDVRGHGWLIRTVSLPGFGIGEPAFVTNDPLRNHDGALVELASDLSSDGLHRPILEKLELQPGPILEMLEPPPRVPHDEAKVVQFRGAA